ncbi:MAG: hypothetical protein AB3X44_16290 [Leptothrix sp. (in: b-proteobacteria)]
MFTENLNAFLADFGTPCALGGQPFVGIFDMPDTQLTMGGASVQTTGYTLQVLTSDVVALGITQGSAITVGGAAYFVRESNLLDDGAYTALVLYK